MGAFGNWNRRKDQGAYEKWDDFNSSHIFDNDARNVSEIPEDISKVFDEDDIEKVWQVLEKTFHVNVKVWKQNFENEFSRSTRNFSKQELFVRFGKAHLEQSLNKILARKELTPTFLNIARYVVRDKIREKKRESDEIRNYYKRK
ncbi:MAG: hypothetical protein QM734_16330 [Cyclobacteriaceae bacterium]